MAKVNVILYIFSGIWLELEEKYSSHSNNNFGKINVFLENKILQYKRKQSHMQRAKINRCLHASRFQLIVKYCGIIQNRSFVSRHERAFLILLWFVSYLNPNGSGKSKT